MTFLAMVRWLVIAMVACSHPAAPTPENRAAELATTKTVHVPPYGDITIEDGALKIMDRGNGDGRVHIMTISRDYQGSKLSWDDKPGRGDRQTDTFPIDDQERTWIRSWKDELWPLAPRGRHTFTKAPPDGKDQPSVVDFLDMHF